MKYLRSTALVMLLFLSVPLLVQAQPGRGNGGIDRTPIAPRGEGQAPDIAITPPAINPEFALPDEWSSVTLPEGLPSQTEIQAMIESFELPFSVDDLNLPASSAEAYTAIVGFGQTYLGMTVNPLYAGTLTGDIPETDVELSIPLEVQTVSAELPAEITSILSSTSGTSFWGIYENGAAAIYTASDCTANCSVTMDNLQVTLTNGSLGLYSVYRDAQIMDATTAQNLILNTYPALSTYTMTPYDVEIGYAFTGMTSTVGADFSARGFLVGVTSAETGQSIVYVIYGIGDGYVSLLPQ